MRCGVDEVGRGCLAGDVFAAAVILPEGYTDPRIIDSKQLSADTREHLASIIEEKALAFAVGRASVEEIDRDNILQATFLAMHRAIDGLRLKPTHIDVDGNRFRPYPHIPHTCIVKGDQTHLHIAAASILAKTARDAYMHTLHQAFPHYGWEKNKGYPTPRHRKALIAHGHSVHHRLSFALLPKEGKA